MREKKWGLNSARRRAARARQDVHCGPWRLFWAALPTPPACYPRVRSVTALLLRAAGDVPGSRRGRCSSGQAYLWRSFAVASVVVGGFAVNLFGSESPRLGSTDLYPKRPPAGSRRPEVSTKRAVG